MGGFFLIEGGGGGQEWHTSVTNSSTFCLNGSESGVGIARSSFERAVCWIVRWRCWRSEGDCRSIFRWCGASIYFERGIEIIFGFESGKGWSAVRWSNWVWVCLRCGEFSGGVVDVVLSIRIFSAVWYVYSPFCGGK